MPGVDGMPAAPMKGLTAVAVSHIEDALVERRRAMVAKLERPQSRACVMTLLVGVEDLADNQPAFNVIEQLAGKYPIRVIAVGKTAESNALSAWVNTACEGDGSVAICTEEIVLQVSSDATDRVMSAVRGALVSELPVMLWWRGDVPHTSALWKGLFSLADRAIVDSHRFTFDRKNSSASGSPLKGHGPAAIATLRELVRAGAARVSLRDLNWQRTAPWRAAIATCFDDRDVLAILPRLDRCSITFASPGGDDPPSARALLMAGWVRARLERLAEQCVVAPGTRSGGLESGRVVAIALTSSKSKASLLLVRKTEPTRVEAQASTDDGKPFRKWNFGAATLTEAELLDGCLETAGRDPLFEASLAHAPS